MQDEHLFANPGFDTNENEPSNRWQVKVPVPPKGSSADAEAREEARAGSTRMSTSVRKALSSGVSPGTWSTSRVEDYENKIEIMDARLTF